MKLSEAAKIYLSEYYILEQAKKNVDEFLNSVAEETYNYLNQNQERIILSGIKWDIERFDPKKVKSKSKLRIKLIATNNNKETLTTDTHFIYVIYKDVQNTIDLVNPHTVRIHAWTPNKYKEIREQIVTMNKDVIKNDIYSKDFIQLDLNSTEKSAEKIADFIINKCKEINIVVKNLSN